MWVGEDQRRRFVAVTNINLGCGPAGGEMQLAAKTNGAAWEAI
jgi:hypothetical protein